MRTAGFFGIVIGLLVTVSSVGAEAGEKETYLALIDLKKQEQWDRLVEARLPIYGLYEGRGVVEISGEQRDTLSQLGVGLAVVDVNPRKNHYFLLYVPEPNLPKVKKHGALLDYRNGTALLQASPSGAERAAGYGFGLTRLFPHPVPLEREKGWLRPRPGPLEGDAFIQSILSNVSQSEITATIRRLQNFRTRYSYTDSCEVAAEYLYERFSSFGLSVSYDLYQYSGQTWRNVAAIHPGLTDSSQIYIICGHYDSINNHQDPWTIAPGADDNASGTAAVVEAARVLSSFDFQATLLFVCFSGEEQGLIGSHHYAQWAYEYGLDIRGVINFDMIAYVADPPDNSWDINIYGDDGSYDLALFLADMVDQYSSAVPYTVNTGSPQYGSDHYPFAGYGYDAIFAIEAKLWGASDWNPYYHSSSDTLGTLNISYATEVVKAGVAALAALAGPIGSGDTQNPTMEAIGEPQGEYYSRAPFFTNFGFDDDTALDDGWYQTDSYTGGWSVLFTNVSGTSWDDNGWSLPEFSALSDGGHIIYFMAKDDAGNVEGESGEWSWQFYKDTTPPSAPIISSPTHPDEADWYSTADVTFHWTEPYDLSGVIGYSFLLDQVPETEPDETRETTERELTYVGLSDGLHYFHCRAGDDLYLWGPTDHYRVMIDTQSPSAPIDLYVEPPGWSNDTTFTVQWAEPEDLSGVAGAYYRLSSPPTFDGDGTFTTSRPFIISAPPESPQPVYVWLQDKAGNKDRNHFSLDTLYFDATAPEQGRICIAGGTDTTRSLVVALDSLSAVDEVSGMGSGALMRFSNDGQTWAPAEPFGASKAGWDLSAYGGKGGSGLKRVYVRYRDVAGNWSAPFSDDIVCSLPLQILTQTLPYGVVGFAYRCSLSATGGWPPYTWHLISGALPSGLSLDSSGTISGLPDSAQISPFEVTVTDTATTTGQVQLSIQIEAPLRGDVNGDRQVDVIDIVYTINIILELMAPTPGQSQAADCYADGAIDILDTVCIVRIVLGGE